MLRLMRKDIEAAALFPFGICPHECTEVSFADNPAADFCAKWKPNDDLVWSFRTGNGFGHQITVHKLSVNFEIS